MTDLATPPTSTVGSPKSTVDSATIPANSTVTLPDSPVMPAEHSSLSQLSHTPGQRYPANHGKPDRLT